MTAKYDLKVKFKSIVPHKASRGCICDVSSVFLLCRQAENAVRRPHADAKCLNIPSPQAEPDLAGLHRARISCRIGYAVRHKSRKWPDAGDRLPRQEQNSGQQSGPQYPLHHSTNPSGKRNDWQNLAYFVASGFVASGGVVDARLILLIEEGKYNIDLHAESRPPGDDRVLIAANHATAGTNDNISDLPPKVLRMPRQPKSV